MSTHRTAGLMPCDTPAKQAARLGALTRARIRQALGLPLLGAYCRTCDQHRTLQPRPWIDAVDSPGRYLVHGPLRVTRVPAAYVYACVICGHPDLNLLVGAAADGYVYEYATLAGAYGRDAMKVKP